MLCKMGVETAFNAAVAIDGDGGDGYSTPRGAASRPFRSTACG